MSFREKTAWVNLIALVLVSLTYWLYMPRILEPSPRHGPLLALAATVGAYILIDIAAYAFLRMRNPDEAAEPIDERERLIDLRAFRIAYYVFVVATFACIFVSLHVVGAGAIAMGMAVTIAFVVAEVIKNAARIVFHRRGF